MPRTPIRDLLKAMNKRSATRASFCVCVCFCMCDAIFEDHTLTGGACLPPAKRVNQKFECDSPHCIKCSVLFLREERAFFVVAVVLCAVWLYIQLARHAI